MEDYIDPTIPVHMQNILRKNMPYQPSTVIKNASILGAIDDPNSIGWVDPKMADKMFINRARQGYFPKNTAGHELEHMLQFNTKRYGTNYDNEVLNELDRLSIRRNKPTPSLRHVLKSSAANTGLNDYLTKMVGEPVAPYIGKMPGGQFSLKEQFAELSSLEQVLRKDLTIDPYVRKHFFMDNQEIIDTYKATSGLRTNRLDPRDLEPMSTSGVNTRYPPPAENQSIMEKLMAMFR
jgi:hypothetical protein